MKIVVGLGNPGKRYEGTRHNAGYEVVATVAQTLGWRSPKERFFAHCWEERWGGESLIVICPTTFMNLSGKSVLAAMSFYATPHQDTLVVCDDINLPLGKLRFRSKGSAGGQKGLADILRQLGSYEIPRLRLGVGAPPDGWDAADYVLGKIEQGITHCMSRYN
jgi:peptidyl-tRNA hydrolase, PTH1 family